MTNQCKITIQQIIDQFNYKCTVDTFKSYGPKRWMPISQLDFLSFDFIVRFKDRLLLEDVLQKYNLPEKICKKIIFRKKEYPVEQYIFIFKRLNYVLQFQKVSEGFIQKYVNCMTKREWNQSFRNQKLSAEFLYKNKELIKQRFNIDEPMFIENYYTKYSCSSKKDTRAKILRIQKKERLNRITQELNLDIVLD